MFLAKHIFNEKNDGTIKILKGNQLTQIHEKFIELDSSNVYNLVLMFKPHLDGGYINIFQLKFKSHYNYIQECCFPSQIFRQKVFLFKMSIDWVGNRTCLITWMQPKRYVPNSWIVFGHVKHVKHWTIMACHVYDPSYYKVDTLPIPWRTQKWVQVQDNGRGRSRGTLPNSQHFEG